MALQRHSRQGGVATAPGAEAAPPSSRLAGAGAGATAAAAEERRLCSGAINIEGKGGVSAPAETFLEGVEPHIGVVDAKVALTEALRHGIAQPLFAPLSGVVGAVDAQGTEVEELTERHRHARAASAAMGQR